jgi:drug/metabolite transporter (DMT)-like permease
VLGALFAVLSAASFAFNNAALRRGVVTGTPIQAMAVTVPVGVLCLLPVALVLGELSRLSQFPPTAMAWMAVVGVVHFVIGRYCNFKANQVAGVNLTAPVVQLQIVVTMVMAVMVLHEPCTLLQIIGGVVMVVASLITQRQPPRVKAAPATTNESAEKPAAPPFVPLYLAGYTFASMAAVSYGSTPVMARFALEHTGPATGILGGLISYVAATAVIALTLLSPPIRKNVTGLKRDNARWFVYSGILVAAAQGFFFCAVSVAPVLLVMPLLQLSLIFRILFSTWLNPNHEVYGALILWGSIVSVAGALLVSADSAWIVHALALPEPIARLLLWSV